MNETAGTAASRPAPQSGARDRDVPGKLRAEFGHKDLGVYLRILEGGTLRPGDPVAIEPMVKEKTYGVKDDAAMAKSLICSACYYLLDPRSLNAAWTTAQDLPADYACPDCGADRAALQPAPGFRPAS